MLLENRVSGGVPVLRGDHFGKRTAWLLLYFLTMPIMIYSLLSNSLHHPLYIPYIVVYLSCDFVTKMIIKINLKIWKSSLISGLWFGIVQFLNRNIQACLGVANYYRIITTKRSPEANTPYTPLNERMLSCW